jgi:hypothetical protein
MTDDEFDEFLAESLAALERKQGALTATFALGSFAAFWFDQPSATLEFRDDGGRAQLVASVVPIGSHSSRSETWMWAWANQSLLAGLREQAMPLRELATVTGMAAFGQPSIKASSPEMPWELTAFAVRLLGAMGAYKAPGVNGDLYLAIMKVTQADAVSQR